MEIINKKLNDLNKEEINKIITYLKRNKVVVVKTDTIYGFSALASNQKAVEKIVKIKKRKSFKSFIILVSSINMASKYGYINSWQREKIKQFIENKKPISFVLITKNKLAKTVESQETLAMRLPKSDFFIKIIRRLGEPLVSTSFNFSGQNLLDINKTKLVFKNKKYQPDLVICSGKSKNIKASRLIDISNNKIKILRK